MKVPLSFPKLKHNLPCAMSACLAQTMVAFHVNLTQNRAFLPTAGLFQFGARLRHPISHMNALRHVQTLTHCVEKLLCLNQLEKSGLQTSNVIARQNGLRLNLTVGPAQGKAGL